MNQNVVKTLIANRYTGQQIADMEMCQHKFDMVMVFSSDDSLRTDAICHECGCDVQAAEIMGLNPENYCGGAEALV